jgi:hypothetical protein
VDILDVRRCRPSAWTTSLKEANFGGVITILSRLRPVAKVGIVAAGYVFAFAIAALVFSVYIAATSGPHRQTSSGMFAFGDSLVFLGVLGVASVPATGAALFFLKSRPAFWRVLSIGSLVVASTAVAAVVLAALSSSAGADPRLKSWNVIVPLRILAAPLLALFFLLSGLFAPIRSARMGLLSASAMEIVAFVCVAFTWWRSTR